MLVAEDAELQVRTIVHRYCDTFDRAEFEAFAALFEHGRWFMVSEPGSAPVLDWINENIVLYDGRPLTRHEVSNLIVEAGEGRDDVGFRCYIAIWQHLPEALPKLLAHARFSGTFRRSGDDWRWHEHVMEIDYAGDLSTHIKAGLASVATG